MDEEEKIWEMMIEKHGRTEYNTVVEIISQYVSLVYFYFAFLSVLT